jgi:hypothetical protein
MKISNHFKPAWHTVTQLANYDLNGMLLPEMYIVTSIAQCNQHDTMQPVWRTAKCNDLLETRYSIINVTFPLHLLFTDFFNVRKPLLVT